jgi:hypothetical protein
MTQSNTVEMKARRKEEKKKKEKVTHNAGVRI